MQALLASLKQRRAAYSTGRSQGEKRAISRNEYGVPTFLTVKSAPAYPGVFPSQESAWAYFREFFCWYNEEHLHTRIGMVTPSQKHSGQWQRILAEREAIKAKTFVMRRAYNRELKDQNKNLKPAVS